MFISDGVVLDSSCSDGDGDGVCVYVVLMSELMGIEHLFLWLVGIGGSRWRN